MTRVYAKGKLKERSDFFQWTELSNVETKSDNAEQLKRSLLSLFSRVDDSFKVDFLPSNENLSSNNSIPLSKEKLKELILRCADEIKAEISNENFASLIVLMAYFLEDFIEDQDCLGEIQKVLETEISFDNLSEGVKNFLYSELAFYILFCSVGFLIFQAVQQKDFFSNPYRKNYVLIEGISFLNQGISASYHRLEGVFLACLYGVNKRNARGAGRKRLVKDWAYCEFMDELLNRPLTNDQKADRLVYWERQRGKNISFTTAIDRIKRYKKAMRN